MARLPWYYGIMGNEYEFNAGDLVYLREWDDDRGWIIKRDIMFMVIDHKRDATGESNRDIVRVIGGGYNIETFGGYFVRAEGEPCRTSS